MSSHSTPNVGADPINPAYYAGTACAEIIEQMPTNVGFAVKYAWRLGEKDLASQEAGKAIWYLERQLRLSTNQSYGYGFYNFAIERITPAFNAGKLSLERNEIVCELVQYTIDGYPHHIHRAIELFRTYL